MAEQRIIPAVTRSPPRDRTPNLTGPSPRRTSKLVQQRPVSADKRDFYALCSELGPLLVPAPRPGSPSPSGMAVERAVRAALPAAGILADVNGRLKVRTAFSNKRGSHMQLAEALQIVAELTGLEPAVVAYRLLQSVSAKGAKPAQPIDEGSPMRRAQALPRFSANPKRVPDVLLNPVKFEVAFKARPVTLLVKTNHNVWKETFAKHANGEGMWSKEILVDMLQKWSLSKGSLSEAMEARITSIVSQRWDEASSLRCITFVTLHVGGSVRAPHRLATSELPTALVETLKTVFSAMQANDSHDNTSLSTAPRSPVLGSEGWVEALTEDDGSEAVPTRRQLFAKGDDDDDECDADETHRNLETISLRESFSGALQLGSETREGESKSACNEYLRRIEYDQSERSLRDEIAEMRKEMALMRATISALAPKQASSWSVLGMLRALGAIVLCVLVLAMWSGVWLAPARYGMFEYRATV